MGDDKMKKCLCLKWCLLVKKNYKNVFGYLYNGNKVEPLNVMLSKTSTYVKRFDGQTKCIYFLILDDISHDIIKEFDRKPVYNKNHWKTKIKPHGNEVTDFYDKEVPKLDSNHTCLAVISLNSALKKKRQLLSASVFKTV